MRALVSIEGEADAKGDKLGELGPLLGQVKLVMIAGIDQEFLADRELAALEVTAAQFAILRNVLKGSAQSACELCRSMDYDRGAMSRMIDRLESKDLIRRVPLPHTRRTMALEVTPAGRLAFPRMEACVERVIGRLLKGVTRAQIRETERVLKRMIANA